MEYNSGCTMTKQKSLVVLYIFPLFQHATSPTKTYIYIIINLKDNHGFTMIEKLYSVILGFVIKKSDTLLNCSNLVNW